MAVRRSAYRMMVISKSAKIADYAKRCFTGRYVQGYGVRDKCWRSEAGACEYMV